MITPIQTHQPERTFVRRAGQALPGSVRFGGTLMPPVPDDFVELSAVFEPYNGNFLPQAPSFFLHGTSTTSSSLERVVHTFSKMAKNQPAYRSYLPEVQFATGIETVKHGPALPAYKMAIRDMGDFRYQLVERNLTRLQKQLLAAGTLAEENRAIGDFFGVAEESRSVLIPVLRKALVDKLFNKSRAKTPEDSLLKLAREGVQKLEAEARKLAGSRLPEILDSHWFFNEAQQGNVTLNWDMNKPVQSNKTANPRIITLEDVGVLETRLLHMEQELAEACEMALSKTASHLKKQAVKQAAQTMAAGFIAKIAPQGNAVGHSQGGLVLALALVNGLMETGKSRNPEKNADLAGRFIGFCLPVAAPVGGMKDLPESFRDMWGMIPEGPMRKAYGDYLWKLGEEIYQAAPEVRDGSPMMEKINANLALLGKHQRTMISLFEKNDLRVEQEDAQLPITHSNRDNCFNYRVNLPDVPQMVPPRAEYEDFLARLSPKTFPLFLEQAMGPWKPMGDMMKKMWGFWLPSNDSMIQQMNDYFTTLWNRQMPNAVQMFMNLHPMGIWMKETGFMWYSKFRQETRQHWAPIVYPNRAFCKDISENFFKKPEQLKASLSVSNFEPFRYQALKVLGASYRNQVLNEQNAKAALQALFAFEKTHAGFIGPLIENAEQGTLISSSAGHEAGKLLNETLDLIEKIAVSEPKLGGTEVALLKTMLNEMSRAQILPLGAIDIPQRAARLKTALVAAYPQRDSQ